jgi:hypothetical protein
VGFWSDGELRVKVREVLLRAHPLQMVPVNPWLVLEFYGEVRRLVEGYE